MTVSWKNARRLSRARDGLLINRTTQPILRDAGLAARSSSMRLRDAALEPRLFDQGCQWLSSSRAGVRHAALSLAFAGLDVFFVCDGAVFLIKHDAGLHILAIGA